MRTMPTSCVVLSEYVTIKSPESLIETAVIPRPSFPFVTCAVDVEDVLPAELDELLLLLLLEFVFSCAFVPA